MPSSVIPDAPFVIPDVSNRESRVFAFRFVCEEKDTGFRVKPGMTDLGCGWLFLYQ